MIVTLDIFSGRPNPSWSLSAKDASKLISRLAGKAMAAADAVGATLGYRGYLISGDADDTAASAGLPDAFRMGLTYPDMSEARHGWRQDDKRHTRLTRQRGILPNDFRRRIGLAGSLLRTAGVLCRVSRLVTVHWITGRNRLLEPCPLRCAELTPASESSPNAIAIAHRRVRCFRCLTPLILHL